MPRSHWASLNTESAAAQRLLDEHAALRPAVALVDAALDQIDYHPPSDPAPGPADPRRSEIDVTLLRLTELMPGTAVAPWLAAAHPALNGQRPADLLAKGATAAVLSAV